MHEIVKKEKEISASSAVAPQTEKLLATAQEKCLGKTWKALNLYNKIFWERLHSHNFYYRILL